MGFTWILIGFMGVVGILLGLIIYGQNQMIQEQRQRIKFLDMQSRGLWQILEDAGVTHGESNIKTHRTIGL